MNTNPPWSDKENAELKRLWATGLSSAKIGKSMGKTKNSIIGRAHRLGLPARPSPIRDAKSAAIRVEKPIKPKPPILSELPVMKVLPAPEPVVAPRRTFRKEECTWITGDVKKPGWYWCKEVAEPGKPFCSTHCKIAYMRVDKAA